MCSPQNRSTRIISRIRNVIGQRTKYRKLEYLLPPHLCNLLLSLNFLKREQLKLASTPIYAMIAIIELEEDLQTYEKIAAKKFKKVGDE